METKDKQINLFTAVLLPLALFAFGWALVGNPIAHVDAGVITLTVLTVFCSCFLRIQLPRINIHLTISDALIILAMIKYGGEIALLIAVIDSSIASLNLRRQGVAIKSTPGCVTWYGERTNFSSAFKAEGDKVCKICSSGEDSIKLKTEKRVQIFYLKF